MLDGSVVSLDAIEAEGASLGEIFKGNLLGLLLVCMAQFMPIILFVVCTDDK